jgi:hypothetical protein
MFILRTRLFFIARFRKIKLRFCGAEVERALQKWFSLWVFWSNVIFPPAIQQAKHTQVGTIVTSLYLKVKVT